MSDARPCPALPRAWVLPCHRMLPLMLAAWLMLCISNAGAAERPPGLKRAPAASLADGFGPVSRERRVQVEAEASWLGDPAARRVRLTVHGRIAPGYYIYALTDGIADNKVATRVVVEGATPGMATESPPASIQDAVFDGLRRVHRGIFRITQEFTLAALPAETGALMGTLIFHVCDGRICSDERRLPFVAAIAAP